MPIDLRAVEDLARCFYRACGHPMILAPSLWVDLALAGCDMTYIAYSRPCHVL